MRCASLSTNQISRVFTHKTQKMAREINGQISLTLLQDIAKYELLIARNDLEDDIPPKRASRKEKPKRIVKQASKTKQSEPKTKKITKSQKNQILLQPSYSGRPLAVVSELARSTSQKRQTRSTKKRIDKENRMVNFKKFNLNRNPERSFLWKSVANCDRGRQSFEQLVSAENTYESLIETIRKRADDIDFGLLCHFLPKNLDVEKQKFSVDFEVDRSQLYPKGFSFSDDIDNFFKQISGSSSKEDLIPLV